MQVNAESAAHHLAPQPRDRRLESMLKKMAASSGRRSRANSDEHDKQTETLPSQHHPEGSSHLSQSQISHSSSHRNPRNMSHGRGGAGNINVLGGGAEPADLTTPTIKSATYTTGRGGSGNMVHNDSSHPDRARRAQDVDPPLHHDRPPQGTFHWGRGGEGNMMTVNGNGNGNGKVRSDASRERCQTRPKQEHRSGSFSAAVNKGREMLNLGRGKAEANGKDGAPVDDSAVADD